MNSKLNSPTPLFILHLVYNTMVQRKFGFRGHFTLMTSRSCPPARTSCKAMLHVFQEWSVRSRLQINTQKTKVMAFFETPSLPTARGGQHQPGPTLSPFHIHAPFPTAAPRSYLITEVLQFGYLGLILDPKLIMHLATTKAIRRAAHGQSVTQAVSYSLRHDKKCSQLTLTQNLGGDFLQNLRYIQIATDVKKLQTSLSHLRVLSMYMVIIQPC